MKTIWIAAATTLALATALAQPVKVAGGLVQGTVENGLTIYRGIPFAAPPLGELRWKPPQPAANWQGVREADKFAPGCMQSMGGPPPSGLSEDCLYLNVWTPAKAAKDRIPVLVWIYGGGFNGGATSIPDYSGERLAKRGVVLVSIAYRVGVLGFYAHPELSAESAQHVSGNYGLLDMIAGLQWIQKNIAAFGGDPKRVTIFGESAGGIAVSMLCSSPLAKGLFTGAISEAAAPSDRSVKTRRRARTCACSPTPSPPELSSPRPPAHLRSKNCAHCLPTNSSTPGASNAAWRGRSSMAG